MSWRPELRPAAISTAYYHIKSNSYVTNEITVFDIDLFRHGILAIISACLCRASD